MTERTSVTQLIKNIHRVRLPCTCTVYLSCEACEAMIVPSTPCKDTTAPL